MAQTQQPMGFSNSPMTAAILGPDILARQLRMQQEAQYGQQMLQEGQQTPQGQMVSGHFVAPSITQYLANGLKSYVGRKAMNDLPNQMASLGQAQMQGVNNLFGVGVPQPSAQAPQDLSQPESFAGGAPGASPMPSSQAFPVGPSGAPPAGAGVASGSSDPSSAGIVASPQMLAQGLSAQPGALGSTQSSVSPQNQAIVGALRGQQPGQPKMPLLPGKTREESAQAFALLGPQGYMQAVITQSSPTDLQKTLNALGIQPGSPQYNQLMAQQAQKLNYTPPANIRAGGFTQDVNGNVEQFPKVPEGYTAVRGANGQWQIQPIAGGLAAVQGTAAAGAAGKASATPAATQYDAQGNPLPTTSVAKVLGIGGTPTNSSAPAPVRNNNPGALMPEGKLAQYPDMQTGMIALDKNLQTYGKQGVNTIAGIISKWAPPNENNTKAYIADVSQRLGVPPNQKLDMTNPLVRQALGTAIAIHENGASGVFGTQPSQPTQPAAAPSGQPSYPAPPLGSVEAANTGAKNLQDEMSKKYKALSETNSQAQTTNSYLQSIATLAKTAAVGPFSPTLQYTNALLSFAGLPSATDAVTANNLLDKYSNQIVARLGTGGLGTDAARTILQSAYPNSHMTGAAISEAVDNIVGANQMIQAKAKLLTPLRNSGDAKAYNNAELAFDQAADPRVWEYKNIQDPTARAKFARQTMQQDPQFLSKLKALQSMGVL